MRRFFFLCLCSMPFLGACQIGDRNADLQVIDANVEETRQGDFGQFVTSTVEAETKAARAKEIQENLASAPAYQATDYNLRQEGVRLSEEALQHRKDAEEAFQRVLEPIHKRLAYLESLHAPQGTEPLVVSLYFDTASAQIRDSDLAQIEAADRYLLQWPIAFATITGYTDTVGSQSANFLLAQRRVQSAFAALKRMKTPIIATLALEPIGEPGGVADNKEDQQHRRVNIIIRPHGKGIQTPEP